jgi:uncharacterized RDD family membrane protein YckC
MSVFSIPSQDGLSPAQLSERAQGLAAPLARRLAAFIYEGVLLFGVAMAVGAIYSIAVGQHHGLEGREGMMATQFLALAAYFMWFWTHGGQTLAMRTWQVRLLNTQGRPISAWQALFRFFLSWLWFMPAWLLAWLADWHQSKYMFGGMLVWAMFYAGISRLLPQQHFLHDLICGTRIIDHRDQLPG